MSGSTPVWVYVIIPILSAIVGYFTNVAAVWMTFHPTELRPYKLWQPEGQPLGFFGWQGIVPAKAVLMSQLLCDAFIAKVLDVDTIFGRVDVQRMASLLGDSMRDTVNSITERVARQEAPDIWAALSPHVKAEVQEVAAEESEHFIADLVRALQKDILDVVDVHGMVGRIIKSDRKILTKMFQETAGREFNFIRRSGIYFGTLFGLVQVLIYVFYKGKWVLPVAGFFVGYATNWVALKLIFAPAKPVNLGCYTLQGLFLKRQKEASDTMARMCKADLLNQEQLWAEVFTGGWAHRWRALLRDTVEVFVRERAAAAMPQRLAAALLVGENRLQRAIEIGTDVLHEELPGMLPACYAYLDEVMAIEDSIRDSLAAMPPEEFIGILHPVFEQDEIKLIIVGGVLGAAAGVLQQFAIFNYVT